MTTYWIIAIIFAIFVIVYPIYKPYIKGYLGEKGIGFILSKLDPQKYKIINDVMLKVNGKTSQIDHVVISNYGVFVIETKNYKGWIVGNEKSEYWAQIIYKRKEKLYNPIRQNYGHVQALKSVLLDYPDVVFIPIVVFSVNADLKIKSSSDVVYSINLIKTIKKYDQEVITDKLKEEIYSRIMLLNIDDKETKKQHVLEINQNKQEKAKKTESNICPKCGGKLFNRKGKRGDFKGCSNFPQCRFTD